MLRTILIIWSLAAVSSTAWAQANEGRLTIDVQGGQVTVFSADAGLSDAELAAIRGQLQERLQRSPLRQRGAVHVTLQGELLAQLVERMHQLDVSDTRATRAVVDDLIRSRFDNQDRPLAEPVEVVVGREFAFGPGNMPGSVVAIGANGSIAGPIADVIALGSHIELRDNAAVTDRLFAVGSQLDLSQGARITGQEVNVSLPGLGDWASSPGSWDALPTQQRSVWARLGAGMVGVLLSLGLGALLSRFAPQISQQALNRMQRAPWSALGIGLAHYFAIVPVLVLLVLTVIGVVFVPLYFVALGLLLWAAYVFGALYVGQSLIPSQPRWRQQLLGLVLLLGASFIPVLGGLVAFGLVTLGVGALMLSCYARFRDRSKRPPSERAAEPAASNELPARGEAPAPQHT